MLGNVLGMLVGFMLGVLIRNSAGAIVGYFVYGFVLPPLLELLAATQDWFADLQPWVDFNYAQNVLFDGSVTGEQWPQLGVVGTSGSSCRSPSGCWIVLRSEVK